ncbi:MAG TPA: riboflavin synthase [Candidatus Acidoferrales bacterium]|nr:riboflavin synthase [Candidatus Acidoferrales bacterium]
MFTGLIEDVGRVCERSDRRDGARFVFQTRLPLRELRPGASIAVNGTCLTVVAAARGRFAVDASPETLRRTNLGDARPGDLVNLERPLRVGDRLGGHFVTAHVDGVGKIVQVRRAGDFFLFRFEVPAELAGLLVPKGAIAVDGISLTVNRCRGARFSATIVPFTWAHTNLQRRRVGDRVNIEADIIGKYVKQLLRPKRTR